MSKTIYKTSILTVPNEFMPLVIFNGAYQTDDYEYLVKLCRKSIGNAYYMKCKDEFFYVSDKFFYGMMETLEKLYPQVCIETITTEV